ncbi:ankyrin repeat and SOCS box protein 3-like [Mercenaria mercenaria]|uniref:ankyrin repeat and SOCS box protein 3-like n=1 Tax=Mercenaria mercenaria TaxID=6596 RepID=UPI00234F764A|nr:ankyrin repeat and SOCS box protein 3-like [Mercenaria mercenaria]
MDFQEVYPDTCSSVSRAARTGNIDLLKRLIRSGKPVDIKDNRGWQPLHEASFHGNTECLRNILKHGAEVDCKTFEEQTPLMLACKGGHPECVACLLRSGADPNSATLEDYTPLWEASLKKNLECVKLLLKAGADVNKQNFTLDTALHGAVQENEDNLDIVKCLVRAGADLTLQNECGLTPLFIAAQFGQITYLELFIEYAASKGDTFKKGLVNKCAEDSATPLFLATQNEHVKCVKLLLDNGADADLGIAGPERPTEFQILPLHMALYKGNRECVEMLVPVTNLEHFTWENNNYNPITCLNYNPVAIAASLESEDCLKVLLKEPFFTSLYSGEENSNYLAERNIFSFNTKIKPAVLLTKKFRLFIEKCFRLNKLVLHECIASVLEDGLEYLPVFILMLRLGATVNFPRYWLDHAAMASCAVDYFCAMLKYTVRASRGITESEKLFWSKQGSNSVSTNAIRHTVIRKLQCHLTTCAQTDNRERLLKEQMGDQYRTVVSPDELFNLQSLCRRTVILQLIKSTGYTKKSVEALPSPHLIKNFILIEDDLPFSEVVLSAFERLEREEIKLDQLFATVDV